MKKISIFFAALAVSAMTMAATFTKVKSAPADWSGEYILVYEEKTDAAKVFTEEADAANNCVDAVIASSSITGTFNTLVIAKIDGGYSIQVKGGAKDGKYLAGSSTANKIFFDDNATAATIEYDATNNCPKIISNTSVMRFNNAQGTYQFRFFKASTYTNQQAVQLYKLKKETTDPIPVTAITADNAKDTVEVGDKLTLKYTITPDSATDQRVEFSIISGEDFISLDNGVVTGLDEGDAQVKVVALDSLNQSAKLSATFSIHVKAASFNTCAEANAAASGTALKLNEVTVVYVNGAYVYVKDASGSTLVYKTSTGLNAGDVVAGIVGTASPYSGLPELKPTNTSADWTITAGEAPAIPAADAAPTAAEVNQVLVWKGVTGMDGEFTTSSASNITGKFDSEDIIFRNNFKIAQTFDKTHSYDITGAVAIYTKSEVTTIQVYFISAEDNGVVTSLVNTEAKKQVRKAMVNGQMVIVRDGKTFNALGVEL